MHVERSAYITLYGKCSWELKILSRALPSAGDSRDRILSAEDGKISPKNMNKISEEMVCAIRVYTSMS